MQVRIRPFQDADAQAVVEILTRNGQYDYPEIEGPEAMARVARCPAAVFLVACPTDGSPPVGMIKAVYDGSRALIHLLSVHPDVQRRGIGKALVHAALDELARRGAPTCSVLTTDAVQPYWEDKGFQRLPAFLMLRTRPLTHTS